MKTPDDLRPPSSIYSHSYKSLYKLTDYKNFVPKSGNSIFHAKWTFDFLLHALRIVGNEKISRQRIVNNSEAFYLSLNRRCRIIFRPSQSSAYKLRELDFLHQPMIEPKTQMINEDF